MPDEKRSALGAGKQVRMPDFKYQQYPGKSGGASSSEKPAPVQKIPALQNFNPAP